MARKKTASRISPQLSTTSQDAAAVPTEMSFDENTSFMFEGIDFDLDDALQSSPDASYYIHHADNYDHRREKKMSFREAFDDISCLSPLGDFTNKRKKLPSDIEDVSLLF
eukprot:CAMPEP_0172483740 /NCGR_PEP_ID=MMETSP1066-20121228/10861_1 /TAXON_ID=671091 /ORGANISM="Coscinodiscus wailesii, Strain CCMP2513" /LENGTH=109 /DNA_ID=CAMNT_0013247809 /DNA_START=358 /DNA_END=687 /DNA_ORIENTATION=+